MKLLSNGIYMTNNCKKKILFSPVSFFGSKRKEIQYIENNQPKDFNKVIDVFGGGGNVSLYYHQNGHVTIYNDIQKYLCDLMNTIQNKKTVDELLNKIEILDVDIDEKKIVTLRDEFIKKPLLENYILLLRHSMRGMIYSGRLQIRKDKKTGLYIKETRGKYNKLLLYPILFEKKKMKVTNLNYLDILNKYKDDKNAFLYLDPPYISTTCDQFYGKDIFTEKDIHIIKRIMDDKSYKCNILLHIEFIGYTYDLFKDHIKVYYPKKYSIKTTNVYQKYIMIATNY
jgi:DNA adenine methylase